MVNVQTQNGLYYYVSVSLRLDRIKDKEQHRSEFGTKDVEVNTLSTSTMHTNLKSGQKLQQKQKTKQSKIDSYIEI